MAARLGLEPRQNESESFVLPLHHRAVKKFIVTKFRGSFGIVSRIGGEKNGVRESGECGLHPCFKNREWSRRWDSNPQPPVYKTGALPLSYAGESAGHDMRG